MPPIRSSDNMSDRLALEKELRTPDFSLAGMQRLKEYFSKFPRNCEFADRFPERFTSLDVAWMAGGLWDDGNNSDAADSFHSLHSICRAGTASDEEFTVVRTMLLETVLNVITAMDRVSGSTTIMLHFDAHDISSVTRGPEGINPEVYITPHLRKEIKNANVTIARIVQMFIEGITMPSLLRWERLMRASSPEVPQYDYVCPPPLIPNSEPQASCLHVFPGRPMAALERAIRGSPPRHDVPTASEWLEMQELYHGAKRAHEMVYSESMRKATELMAVRAELEAKNKKLRQQERKIAKQEEENRQQQAELCEALERVTALSGLVNDLQLERHVLEMVAAKKNLPGQAGSSEASVSNNASSSSTPTRRTTAIEALGRNTVDTVKRFKLPPAVHRQLFELYNSQVNALWFEDLMADGGITVKAAAALVKAMHADLDMVFNEALCIPAASK
ncbi:hypothetical protein PHLCEN_2v7279 [Hermanssonia centrifuga]|uniref:Uncharacterized protein n=1 Tax=Hermanssonia centrifuga TaxID=98765 RepID=A0A2R6NX09_9APHY|nr:hypothetical protein PHLCEN_2v7279 [Hermanssonia centrifuga]